MNHSDSRPTRRGGPVLKQVRVTKPCTSCSVRTVARTSGPDSSVTTASAEPCWVRSLRSPIAHPSPLPLRVCRVPRPGRSTVALRSDSPAGAGGVTPGPAGSRSSWPARRSRSIRRPCPSGWLPTARCARSGRRVRIGAEPAARRVALPPRAGHDLDIDYQRSRQWEGSVSSDPANLGSGSTRAPARSRPVVVIVGAGAAGTLTALHLLRRLHRDRRAADVVLVDPSPGTGRGTAYGTT